MTCVSPPEDLWCVASPSSQLRGTEFGSEEMQEMWKKMGGVLSAGVHGIFAQ